MYTTTIMNMAAKRVMFGAAAHRCIFRCFCPAPTICHDMSEQPQRCICPFSAQFRALSSSSSTATQETTNASMLQILRDQVAAGKLRSDKAQERVAKRLSRLQQALVGYDNEVLFQRPPISEEQDFESSATVSSDATKEAPSFQNSSSIGGVGPSPSLEPALKIPRGLYIHGPVGTGKSMLMDTFYENAPVDKKARYHFHNFLAQVHKQIHHLKQQDLKEKGRTFSIDTSIANNPIHRVALQLSRSTSLLCLDEFQVTDIADAVILSQLFGVLFVHGTVVVATSNRPPQDLYEGGLNRSYFLPFLDLLERHCIAHSIQSEVDYRKALASCSSFFGSASAMEPALQQILEDIVNADIEHPTPLDLPVGFQRTIHIAQTYHESSTSTTKACRLDCSELCDADVGAMDFRAIARNFKVVCLENVQSMDLRGHNRARRFITLIDELYEAKCCLLMSTSSDVTSSTDLFQEIVRTSQGDPDDPDNILGVDVSTQGGMAVGALASVRELEFAFERASSRIVEMCSRSWWEKRLALQPEST